MHLFDYDLHYERNQFNQKSANQQKPLICQVEIATAPNSVRSGVCDDAFFHIENVRFPSKRKPKQQGYLNVAECLEYVRHDDGSDDAIGNIRHEMDK